LSDSLLITSLVISILSLSVVVGYILARKSRRAGITVTSAVSFLALVLIVDYFVEVPVVVVAATLTVVAASVLFALLEIARKDAMQHPG
jgi:hypothetical protein